MYNDQRGLYYQIRQSIQLDPSFRYSFLYSLYTSPVYIGIGQSLPWLIEATPPSINPIFKYPLELFIKATNLKLAVKPTRLSNSISYVNGFPFSLVPDSILDDITDFSSLSENKIRLLYLEFTLPTIRLDFSSFRHLCVVDTLNLKQSVDSGLDYYKKDEVDSYTPTYMENFRPIRIQNRVSQRIQVLVEV